MILSGLGASLADPQPGRVYRLLMLDSQTGAPYSEIGSALLETLDSFGYREGENLQVVHRSIGNDLALGITQLDAEHAGTHDVIYVGGTLATLAAREVCFGTTQPVVFAATTDPVGLGIIDAFDRPPKANFTGVSYPVPVAARLRFIRHLLPQAHHFGMIYADMPQSRSYNEWLRRLMAEDPLFRELEVAFAPVPLITGDEGDRHMSALVLPQIEALDPRVDAFIAPNDQLGSREAYTRLFPAHASKPLIGLTRSEVMEGWGALASVFPLHENIGQMAAVMVRDLFEGRPLSEIEPRWPDRFGYAVNLGKAQAFGINVPVGILQLAGENIRQ